MSKSELPAQRKGLLVLSLKLTAGKIFGLALILGACAPPPPPPPPPPVTYEITGNVKVTNDCDGLLASIRNQVTIETDLMNSSGSIAVPGRATVNINPDPADPNNPVKIGVYSIQVRWPAAAGNATQWKWPVVLSLPNGPDVCVPITCAQGTGPCKNVATGANITPANPPAATNHDVETVCACN